MFLPVQAEALVRAVRREGVRHYCEVGFNGGHTSAAALAGTGSVSVRSFDFGLYGEKSWAPNLGWVQLNQLCLHFRCITFTHNRGSKHLNNIMHEICS